MRTDGFGVIEVTFLAVLSAVLFLPVLTLSSRNVQDHQELLERALAHSLCLDMVERFKSYKPYWPLPGSEDRSTTSPSPPLEEMFLPLELQAERATTFDGVYLDHLKVLRMEPRPTIRQVADPNCLGLYRLEVSTSWIGRGGQRHELRFARYCYAP